MCAILVTDLYVEWAQQMSVIFRIVANESDESGERFHHKSGKSLLNECDVASCVKRKSVDFVVLCQNGRWDTSAVDSQLHRSIIDICERVTARWYHLQLQRDSNFKLEFFPFPFLVLVLLLSVINELLKFAAFALFKYQQRESVNNATSLINQRIRELLRIIKKLHLKYSHAKEIKTHEKWEWAISLFWVESDSLIRDSKTREHTNVLKLRNYRHQK